MDDLDTKLEKVLLAHLDGWVEFHELCDHDADSHPVKRLRDAVINEAKHWVREILDGLRSDRPFDSGPYRNLGSREPFDSDQYNTETRGYREALTDVELALRPIDDGESDGRIAAEEKLCAIKEIQRHKLIGKSCEDDFYFVYADDLDTILRGSDKGYP